MFRRQTTQVPTTPTEYPAGSFVKSERGYFYISALNKRYRILSKRVLDSWSPARVIVTSEAALSSYRVVAKMKFRNGSLINSMGDGRVYLIVGGKKCPVVSPDALSRINAKYSDAMRVSKIEAELHEIGDELA